MIKVIINNRECKTDKDKSILKTAAENGISIPSLCNHPFVEPAGVCRLCLVEIEVNGRRRLVTSCNYQVEDGLIVRTDTDEVIETRKWILKLLLARCPDSEIIQGIAGEHGIRQSGFIAENDKCILCGLCVRICAERMGRNVINFTGRGIDRKVDTPWKFVSGLAAKRMSPADLEIQTDYCMTCGACAFICPTGAIKLGDITSHKPVPILSEFNQGLNSRSPVYVPYPQGVPNVPVIDRETCVHFRTGKCGICADSCPAGAINYEQEDEVVEINAGAIILSPGFTEYDPCLNYDYGFKRYSNVVTSIQFERMLSASGPYGGELVHPGNSGLLKKIAWIQCIGSRDANNKREYCSTVCCTYAIKQAIIAREHAKNPLSETIFYMDMRTQGKDFDRFYERAQNLGVRFVRGRVFRIEEAENKGNVLLTYTNEKGDSDHEEYDLVVLSVGLKPAPETIEMVKRAGVQLNKDGFCHSEFPNQPETSKQGIFVAGGFGGPVDIPDTVMQASAAAGSVSVLLHKSRNTLTKIKEYPEERDVSTEEPRIGVFVCHCGINIGGVVNVPSVADYAKSLKDVVYVEHNLYTCSQDTQERIKALVKEHGLNRVVVASCSPRTHESLFQETIREACLNKYLFEMANIRDQCSWVHMHSPGKATEKAKDLVRMAVAKVRLAKPLKLLSLPVVQSALVIGGGIAGMTAALMLADQGFKVYLLEKTAELGGMASRLYYNLNDEDIRTYLNDIINQVSHHPLISVYLNTTIINAAGYVGNFITEITKDGGAATERLEHGAVIIATGAKEFVSPDYFYGKDKRVVTQLELEKRIVNKNPEITGYRTAVMILCAGSRNEEHRYCSKVCCMQAVKNALKLKELNPEMDVFILYRDMRTYGFFENHYKAARAKGITFLCYEKDKLPEVQKKIVEGQDVLHIELQDMILGEKLAFDTDILTLSVPMVPPEDAGEIATLYKVPRNEDGFFLEAHVKLRPVDFATDGIFVCGLAHSPKPVSDSIIQAKAAASRASAILSKEYLQVQGIVCEIPEDLCSGCGVCVSQCTYKAITLNKEKKIAVVNEALCKGCGCCTVACPAGVAQQRGFTAGQISGMIDAALSAGDGS